MFKNTIKIGLCLSIAIISTSISAQVGIGITAPKAALDITAANDGLLIPRIALSATNVATVITPTISELVYNTFDSAAGANQVTEGFYYWDGTLWVKLGSGSSGWELHGNSATIAGTNYIGTTDNVDLHISRQGSDQIRLTSSTLVINENSDDRDLRIESDNNTSLLYINAGTDQVIVNSPAGYLSNTNFQTRTDTANRALAAVSIGSGVPGFFEARSTSTASYAIQANNNNGGIAIIADNDFTADSNDTFVAFSDSAEGFGAGWFVNSDPDDATGYGTASSSVGILSDMSAAGEYHIGVYGKSTLDSHNMGVYGNSTTPSAGSFTTNSAGALGYRSNNKSYGGFFEGAELHIDGAFKTTNTPTKEQTSIGFAAKGGLMGGWTKGAVYGLATEGERFSLYVNGREFTNDVITQLNDNNNSNKIATYVPTSTTVDVTSKGVSKLSNGRKRVNFKDEFSQLSSTKEPVIVTVTPLGKSNGVYIETIDANGFTIVENNNGNANVKFTWIAIATRKGYETVENPEELLAHDYDKKLSKFMTGNILNSKEVEEQEMWWDGNKIQYSKAPKPQFDPKNSVKAKSIKSNNIETKDVEVKDVIK